MQYWIGLGSNLGDRLENLKLARQALNRFGTIQCSSPVYQTAAWGKKDQPPFLNAVVLLESGLNPFRLLRKLKQTEVRLGRTKSERWGPRKIDLDILEWEGTPVETSILKIPHPLLKQRVFVLQPMAWIDQQFTFRSGEKIATLLQQLEGRDDCQLLIEKW